MDEQLRISAEQAAGSAGGLKLRIKGSGVRHLLSSSARKPQPAGCQDGSGGNQQADAGSPSQGGAAVSDSPGRPFSPSSAEPSPAAAVQGQVPWAGPRTVHGQPPGKQPYPDDRTPEAEAVRAKLLPPEEGAAAAMVAAAATAAAAAAAAAGDGGLVREDGLGAAGPRSVHGQPPGKPLHPDDPAFGGAAAAAGTASGLGGAAENAQAAVGAAQRQLGYGSEDGDDHSGGAGPRSVHGRPPGKQPDQIAKIQEVYQPTVSEGEEEEEAVAMALPPHLQAAHAPHAPWRQQQQRQQHVAAVAGPPRATPQQHVAAAAAPEAVQGQPAYVPAPAASSHQARQRAPPHAPGGSGGGAGERPNSRKRPAAGGEGGQRKKAANGAAAGAAHPGGSSLQRLPTGISTSRPYSSGVPASLARTGSFGGEPAAQHIRPMPGAPRSLQQRQQLVNGATGGGGARPAGAPRPKQQGGSASKPKQQSKAASSAQRRPSSGAGAGGGGGGAAAAHQYKPGDVVWAKIGVYPWWPAQLQRPTADEHFKPKHAASDLFCVFYGSNDYNWLPASALKPFVETHPDYMKHASVKNKALQRSIDEAWVYGVQRQRPDVHYGPGYGV